MQKAKILIIDDERNTREGLQKTFAHKYNIILAEDATKGLHILAKENIDVVLTDLRMPGIDGMQFIREVTKQKNPPLIVMLTAYGSLHTAVEAMKVGAYDYLTKPVNLDNLEMVIDRGLESIKVSRENKLLRQELKENQQENIMIGESKQIREVFDTITQVAPMKTTILLTGESGTGKELAAKALHTASKRADKPFVVVHCAALNANLLESELFGHEKGSFTGAHEKTIGRFEKADGGTIFLDEIGEIDPSTQIKLLRVIENMSFERVGGSKTIFADVRLVAATNRNLKEEVEKGNFREDLYYRLNVINIKLPALRERKGDIPLLLQYFLKKINQECGVNIAGFSEEAQKILTAYQWPGNIRELRNCVERMVVMTKSTTLTLNDVPLEIQKAVDELLKNNNNTTITEINNTTLDLTNQERNLIARALKESNQNRTEAAKKLGISRRTLYRKIEQYNLVNK